MTISHRTRWFFVSAMLAGCAATGDLTEADDEAIVGGSRVTDSRYDSIVWLGGCGGTLIAPTWVATAAHCVVEGGVNTSVRIGSLDRTRGGELIELSGAYLPTDYNENTNENDIAILQLAKPSTHTPAPFMDVDTAFELEDRAASGTTVPLIAAGWGATRERGRASRNLNEVSIPLVPHESCNVDYLSYFGLDTDLRIIGNGMICAGSEGLDTCQGDSGGPLYYDDGSGPELFGIVSWGFGCGREGLPGVYSNAAIYASWFESVMSEL